jgi:hypothetical protein
VWFWFLLRRTTFGLLFSGRVFDFVGDAVFVPVGDATIGVVNDGLPGTLTHQLVKLGVIFGDLKPGFYQLG